MNQILQASSNINLKLNLIKRLFNFKQVFNFALFFKNGQAGNYIINSHETLWTKGF